MKKIGDIVTKGLDFLYSGMIFVCLFGGGLTFLGFVIAFIIGGETATVISVFIYKKVFKLLIYGGNIGVCLGLLSMYLKNQKSLTMNDENREAN